MGERVGACGVRCAFATRHSQLFCRSTHSLFESLAQRGISPTVREGSITLTTEPSLTVGLAPQSLVRAGIPAFAANTNPARPSGASSSAGESRAIGQDNAERNPRRLK